MTDSEPRFSASSDDPLTAGARPPGKSELRDMMRDEVARNEVRTALTRRRFWSHPLMIAISGALLIFVVGSWIVGGLVERTREDQLRREALEAVRDFSAIASERTERMALLASALQRGAEPRELIERKARYDETYVNWNTNLQRNYLYFREAFGYTFKTFAEYAIDNSLSQLFTIYDACLTEAYDARLGDPSVDGFESLSACLERRGIASDDGAQPSAALQRRLRTCRDEIYGVLNHFVMKDINCGAETTWRPREQPNGESKPAVVDLTYAGLMRLCEMTDTPELPPVSEAEYNIFCVHVGENSLLSSLGLDALAEMF